MQWYNSVRLKIILGFAFVIVPIVAFLFYNNMYSIRIVREQISKNYDSLLQEYVHSTDQMLDETSLYLYRFVNDPDFATLYAFGNNSDDYYMTKIRIMSKLTSGIGYFNVTSSIFIYSPVYKDLLLASSEDHNIQTTEISRHADELARNGGGKWQLVKTSDGYAIVMIAVISSELVAGVWVHPDKLLSPLRSWNLGPGGEVALMDANHSLLNSSRIGTEVWGKYSEKDPSMSGNYLLIDAPTMDEKMLLVKADSTSTRLRFMLAIPETTILRGLPFFQKAIYIIPFGVLIMLFFYFSLLQRILISPFSALIKGMRRIGQGRLDTRLYAPKRGEFAYLMTAFNDMADQIRSLKINVYEEKLRVQQAEYKHLQVQINPHFYMNSLNIIYNLAVLKDYQTLKKMALHLADYFRFTIHSNRPHITLADELKHIANYMEIQRLRYPDNLTYEIVLPDELRHMELPPLTVQPFAENAILHGFKKRNQAFHISIVVEADQEEPDRIIHISIRDTGIGFTEEWLQEFGATDWRGMQGEHVGIWNVMRRLSIHYGEEAAVLLRNTPDGAEVLLSLPIIEATREGEPEDV
jgi:two-component system, sensor histidine kinase YesM